MTMTRGSVGAIWLSEIVLFAMLLAGCSSHNEAPSGAQDGTVASATPVARESPLPNTQLAARESAPVSTPPSAPKVRASTVAVSDFEGGSIPTDKTTEFWGRALQTFMIADLAAAHSLRVVDREYLAQVLQEQRISATDLADPATRIRVGKILGARYFIFGTYTIIGEQAALTARMDSVETGQIFEADSVSGDKSDLRELSRQLAGKFLRPLDRVVAEQELHPQAAGEPPPDAVSSFNLGLGYEQEGQYDKAVDMFTRALTIYPRYAAARSELERASDSAARQQ